MCARCGARCLLEQAGAGGGHRLAGAFHSHLDVHGPRASLTNGAFYAHFESKEDLVATTVADQLREQRETHWQRPGAGEEQLVREYLSVRHRDDPEHGCPSAALLDEIGRCATATKQAYTAGELAIADEIAARLAPHDPASARARTLSLFALLISTLQLSRALADRSLADEVLERGIENALALLRGA